jgi:NAD(P)-dependent dehydrogenase (short-subunit alcohol dehydrogenase family)
MSAQQGVFDLTGKVALVTGGGRGLGAATARALATATVAFLLSDDAAYVNGHAVMVDGGQTIHGHPRWFRTDYRQAGQDVWEPVQ